MPLLSTIIITYKTDPEVLRRCLQSVAGQVGIDQEVIIVDNAGDASVLQFASDILPKATCIMNSQNKGFAYAVNQGMKASKGDYVLLLNPDTEVPADACAKMVAHMEQDLEVGIASSIIRYPDGKLQDSIRRFPALFDQLIILSKLPHVLKRIPAVDHYMMRDVDPMKTQDVDSIMGAFMFIRRSVIDKIGMFDERYFIWYEEVDYCKMAVDAGFKVRHYADVEMFHHKGHSFNKVATIKKQYWVRQSLRKYMKKHHGILPWLLLTVLNPLFIVLAYGAALVKRG